MVNNSMQRTALRAAADAERYVRIKGAINDLAEFVLETTQSHTLPVSYSI
jgi:hypothetical protein